jgi:hypothetical protein
MATMYPGGSKNWRSVGKIAPFQPKVIDDGSTLRPGSPKSAFPKISNTKTGSIPNQRIVDGITKAGGKFVNPTYNTY